MALQKIQVSDLESNSVLTVALLMNIIHELSSKGVWRAPRVYCEGERRADEVRATLTRHGAFLLRERAGAEIVVLLDAVVPNDAGAVQVVFELGQDVLVHTPRTPDSYNSVVPAASGKFSRGGQSEASSVLTPTAEDPVSVSVAWVDDLDRFNEWPNLSDYVVEDATHTKRRRAEPTTPVKTESGVSAPAKETGRLKRVKSGSAMSGEDVGPGKMVSATPLTQLQTVAPASYETGKVPQMFLPSSASWFSLSTIHQIEKDALPEFFSAQNDPTKSPEIYKDFRDFMVHVYWQNPSQYLSYTACRRNLGGDACALMRVHQFLQQKGIINFMVGGVAIPTPIPSGNGSVVEKKKSASKAELLLETRRVAYDSGNGPLHICHSCGSVCKAVRYDNQADDQKQVWDGEITIW